MRRGRAVAAASALWLASGVSTLAVGATSPLPPPSTVPSPAPVVPPAPPSAGAAGAEGGMGPGAGAGTAASPPAAPGGEGAAGPLGGEVQLVGGAGAGAAAGGGGGLAASVGSSGVGAFPSDHDAVVGGWGIEVTPVLTERATFARRPSTGCVTGGASAATGTGIAGCGTVSMAALGVRHWLGRSLAINAALALSLEGGKDHGRLLDTSFGGGPVLGASFLLGNWQHLAILASPAASLVFFRAARSADTAFLLDVRGDAEAELHFGFWGLPALSLSLRSGLVLHLERGGDVTVWSLAPAGATSLSRLVTDLTLRYYL